MTSDHVRDSYPLPGRPDLQRPTDRTIDADLPPHNCFAFADVNSFSIVMTMMVTNAILGGIADTVAQTITAFRQRSLLRPNDKDDGMSIPLSDLDRKGSVYDRGLVPNSKALPPTFDFERLTRFMAYGFCMAPVQFKWFRFLERIFPITKTSAFGPAMKRVAFDQLIFAPFGVGIFFTAMTIAEGGGRRAVTHKLKDMYIPTLKANYVVWPAVQIVNFRLMPVQYQLVSCSGDDFDVGS